MYYATKWTTHEDEPDERVVFKETHTPFRSNEKRVDTEPAAFVPLKRTSSFRVRCATTELNEIADARWKSARNDRKDEGGLGGSFILLFARAASFLTIRIKANLRSNTKKEESRRIEII